MPPSSTQADQPWNNRGVVDVIKVPTELLPRDGRFGSGPAKIRVEAVQALAGKGARLLGTSHRQAPVRGLVGAVRAGLAELFAAPAGYQLVLGNGGSTLFWDVAICSLIERRSSHAAFGEFSTKFAAAARRAPHLDDPLVATADPGGVVLPQVTADADTYAWAQNETSTGAIAPVQRLAGTEGALTLIDATSGAGGTEVDLTETDVYYFAPQKSFGSDGGLWLAWCSPAALERTERLATTDRWIPDSLSLKLAYDNSIKNQTLNTPAIATLFLLLDQVSWLNDSGGLPFAAGRSAESAKILYDWADASELATPFVAVEHRSPVVGTIDFDASVDAAALAATLRVNGIVDTEPYRSLGRNQLRIGMYPTVDPDDVRALTRCIDWVISAQRAR